MSSCLENTSFSDVIVTMLTPYAINYLSAFKGEHERELGKENERLDHLMSNKSVAHNQS